VLLNINQNYTILVKQNQQNPLPFTSIISMFYVILTDAHRRFLWNLGDVFQMRGFSFISTLFTSTTGTTTTMEVMQSLDLSILFF
jgi:hypothetical protein